MNTFTSLLLISAIALLTWGLWKRLRPAMIAGIGLAILSVLVALATRPGNIEERVFRQAAMGQNQLAARTLADHMAREWSDQTVWLVPPLHEGDALQRHLEAELLRRDIPTRMLAVDDEASREAFLQGMSLSPAELAAVAEDPWPTPARFLDQSIANAHVAPGDVIIFLRTLPHDYATLTLLQNNNGPNVILAYGESAPDTLRYIRQGRIHAALFRKPGRAGHTPAGEHAVDDFFLLVTEKNWEALHHSHPDILMPGF
jgi:hypothetical protein